MKEAFLTYPKDVLLYYLYSQGREETDSGRGEGQGKVIISGCTVMVVKHRPKDSALVLCMNPGGTHSQQGISAAATALLGLTQPDRMVAGGKKPFCRFMPWLKREGRI